MKINTCLSIDWLDVDTDDDGVCDDVFELALRADVLNDLHARDC